MSETFANSVAKIDLKKYITETEEELGKILKDVGPGKTPQEIETTQTRLQALVRRQAQSLSREIGFTGNHVMVFMIGSTILTTAFLSYAVKKETLDMSKPFERKLVLSELLNSLEQVLAKVIAESSNFADMANK